MRRRLQSRATSSLSDWPTTKLAPAAMNSAAVGASMIVPAPSITSGSSRLTRRARSENVA